MSIRAVRHISQLESPYVLAPERYDPRRSALGGGAAVVPLKEVALSVRRTISPFKAAGGRYIVLDTSDAHEGIVAGRKEPVDGASIGSAKKVAKAGDVIISRLRPYLRQVALVDDDMRYSGGPAELACSTEFFILRSVDEEPIGFLVPFLLSGPVQRVLAASQEGGHHPRFNESTLLELPIPRSLLAMRRVISSRVKHAVKLYRQCERMMTEAVRTSSDKLE